MPLVDSHCHLDKESFAADLDAVVARARAAGVTALVAIGAGTSAPASPGVAELAQRYPFVFFTCGLHPHDARLASPAGYDSVKNLLARPHAVAVGEIGLDYHYLYSPRDAQREAFVTQLQLATELNLPVVIHIREAFTEALELLDAHYRARPAVIHCFTGTATEVRAFIERGFFISIPGVVTFKNAEAMREAVPLIPTDRLLVETDSPFLAPVPYRGKRCEPAFVVETVKAVARLRGLEFDEAAALSAQNAAALFRFDLAGL
jgi:TatD DNase family protein